MNELVDKYPSGASKRIINAQRVHNAIVVWKTDYPKWKSMKETLVKDMMEKLPVKSLPGSPFNSDKALSEVMNECSEQRKKRLNELQNQFRKVEFIVFYKAANDTPTIVGRIKLESK